MEKIETLYKSIEATNALNKYIYDIIYNNKLEDNKMLDPLTNKILEFSLAKYMILSLKEEIILHLENVQYDNNLLFSSIKTLAEKIAVINEDGTVNLGDYKCDNCSKLVAEIRNKLAHGAYNFSDDGNFIIFNFTLNQNTPQEQQLHIPIDLEALLSFACDLLDRNYEYKSTDEHTKIYFVLSKKNIPVNTCNATDEKMRELLSSFIEYKFYLYKEDGVIPKEAYQCFDKVQERMEHQTHYYRDSSIEVINAKVNEEIESFVSYFTKKSMTEKWGVSLSYEKITLSEEKISTVLDVFKKIKGKNIPNIIALTELPYYANRAINLQANKRVGVTRCSDLLACLHKMMEMNTSNILTVAQNLTSCATRPVDIDQDIYGMVQIARLLDFSYMFENFSVDYDKLPMSKLKPTIFNYVNTDINELKNRLTGCMNRINKIIEFKKKTIEHIESVEKKEMDELKKKEVLQVLNKQIADADNRILAVSELSSNCLEEINAKDEKYYYNKYLLERMRDSISHGNVYIIPTGYIADTIIRLEDIYEGKLVFSIDITIRDLVYFLDEVTKSLTEEEVKIRRK